MFGLLPLALVFVSSWAQAAPTTLTLEIRVFLAGEEVTGETRVTVHRAGDRSAALAQMHGRDGRVVIAVPQGIYDAQVVRERDGRVLNIRWAERLVVMPYPDEGGKHLEVVNFTNGYGALQIKASRAGPVPETAVFAPGERTRAAAVPIATQQDADYTLFVVPAGRYDIQVRGGQRPAWHADIEVPLDRTRLWLIQ